MSSCIAFTSDSVQCHSWTYCMSLCSQSQLIYGHSWGLPGSAGRLQKVSVKTSGCCWPFLTLCQQCPCTAGTHLHMLSWWGQTIAHQGTGSSSDKGRRGSAHRHSEVVCYVRIPRTPPQPSFTLINSISAPHSLLLITSTDIAITYRVFPGVSC